MIKHIVMWNVRAENDGERIDAANKIKHAFEGLRGRIPGLLMLEIGIDTSRIDYACDVLLYTEFESKAALECYSSHPEHALIKEAIAGLRISRHQVDFEPQEQLR
jgi:hypothetical protein